MTTVTLSKPIVHDGKTIESIEVCEPSVAAIEALEAAIKNGAGEAGAAVALLEVDSGIPADALRKIKISDFRKVTDALSVFTEALEPDSGAPGAKSPPTSPTS